MEISFRFSGLVLGAVFLSACAGGDQYPSLALQPGERFAGQFNPAPEPPSAPAIRSSLSHNDIAIITGRAEAADARFRAAEPASRSALDSAQGTARDSRAFGDAIVALSDLTALRSRTAIALSDLDLMKAEASIRFEDTAIVEAAQAEVVAMLARQDATLTELWGRLER